MSNITNFLTFTGPIPVDGRRLAEKWCKQQATPEKGEQVRLNILSVSFVNSYLQYMGFETELEASDSWNPLQQTLMDVADLQIKNLGKLECRPVLAGTVYIPPSVMSDRIGYVAVQISESFREATLLGFVKQVSTDSLPIGKLQSMEDLLEYLEYLQLQQEAPSNTLVNLKQWFENIFEVSWQSIETLLGTEVANLALRFRSLVVERAKVINLGMQPSSQSVILVVRLSPENKPEMSINVEVYPNNGQTYLPANLQLMVLDEEGTSVMEAKAKNSNKNIQFQFIGEPGERFSVKVVLGDVSAIENFII